VQVGETVNTIIGCNLPTGDTIDLLVDQSANNPAAEVRKSAGSFCPEKKIKRLCRNGGKYKSQGTHQTNQ
jgi:hypothetical protein